MTRGSGMKVFENLCTYDDLKILGGLDGLVALGTLWLLYIMFPLLCLKLFSPLLSPGPLTTLLVGKVTRNLLNSESMLVL